MTTPDVPHHLEVELEVPGTAEQVWRAIATAEGIASWMTPLDLEARLGGALTFHMGPDADSHGRVTAFEPGKRFAYEEDWAALVGHDGADVTPLATEFLVEARSGGTCVVRVVTSAFGTGADWEHEFWEEMSSGWVPMLDNLRLYLTSFPDQHASSLFARAAFRGASPEAAIAEVRRNLGLDAVGDRTTARGVTGRLERSLDRHVLVRVDEPVPGFLSFQAFAADDAGVVHLQGYLFSEAAPDYVMREQPGWQRWLEALADDVAPRPA